MQHDCELDNLWTGFEVAEGYRIGQVTGVNFQDTVRQGSLFRQDPAHPCAKAFLPIAGPTRQSSVRSDPAHPLQ